MIKIKNHNKCNRKVLVFGLWLHSHCWWWWQLEGFFVYSYYIPQCDIIIWLGLGPRPSQDEFTRGGWSADQHESNSRELRLDWNSTLEGPNVCSRWGRRSWWFWLVAVIVAAAVLQLQRVPFQTSSRQWGNNGDLFQAVEKHQLIKANISQGCYLKSFEIESPCLWWSMSLAGLPWKQRITWKFLKKIKREREREGGGWG